MSHSNQHNCYDEFLTTVDFTDHVDDIENKSEFSFTCPSCGKVLSYENNFDGTVSEKR